MRKPIKNFEGIYEISDDGYVITLKRDKYVKKERQTKGYKNKSPNLSLIYIEYNMHAGNTQSKTLFNLSILSKLFKKILSSACLRHSIPFFLFWGEIVCNKK